MVGSQYGPPRLKPRPYEDGRRSDDGNYSPNSKDRGGGAVYQAKGSFNYRESRGRGRPPVVKRVPLMGEPREQRFNHWRSQNQDSFQRHSPKVGPGHGQRRPVQGRLNRSPEVQHQSSSYSPSQGYNRHRGPAFHGHPSGHRTPSPRQTHTHDGDRRPGSAPHYQGPYRDPKRQAGFIPQDHRGRAPRGIHGTRDRLHDRLGHGMKRWNEDGNFSHPHNGEHRHSGSQRNPREMHGRGSNPERWSPEQDSRRQRGPMERQDSRSHSRERAHIDPHPPPYRVPPWKVGPPLSASYHRSPPERQMAAPRKRRISDVDMPSSDPAVEQSRIKYPRRERPQLLSIPRPFGGKPLSLRDKSLLIKNRQMRAESLMNVKLPPSVKARQHLGDPRGSQSSILALRKKRFQPNAAPLRGFDSRGEKVKRLTTREENPKLSPSRDSDTTKEQVESRRSLNSHRSSPIEKRDLVVLSHWPAGPSSSSKDCSPRNDCSPTLRTDRSSARSRPPHWEGPKVDDPRSPHEDGKRRYLDRRTFRPFKVDQYNHRPGGFFRKPGFGPIQRSKLFGPRKPGPEPLMESLVPRPFPSQRPVFRKSHSILTKYRNMRVMRQRPPFTRGPIEQRW